MGIFKIKNDKRNGMYIGFIKGDEIEIYTYGEKVKLNIDEVEQIEILN
jgi:hypothetical protein